jgi:peptide subunit release factor 1 (eRF1)
MPRQRIDERLLHRLRGDAPKNGPIVSLYLDLDLTQFSTPEARDSQLNSLLTEAGRIDPRARDITKRIRDEFDAGWPADGAAGLAVFAAKDWLRVIQLPRQVELAVWVGDVPMLEPLAEMIESETWAVWLVNRRTARIMLGTPEHLTEVEEIEDVVHGKHHAGGWSQARYQRSVEQDVDNHLKHAAQRLDAVFKRTRFDRLIVAPEEEIKSRVIDALPPEVAALFVDTMDVDIENSKPDDVADKLKDVVQRRDALREKEAIERLAEQLAKKGRAAEGTAGVLTALNEQAVEVLLYDPGARPSGTHCPTCGLLDHEAKECPIDGTKMDTHEDILDLILDRTVAQSGELLPIKHHKLDVKNGIAALTRF